MNGSASACQAKRVFPHNVAVLCSARCNPRMRTPLSVLVVDDHVDTAQFLLMFLHYVGCVGRAAAGMEEALLAAQHVQFDVLVTDVLLTDGDGCDLLGDLRKSNPAMIGIAVSGDNRQQMRCLESGFAAFLLKPVTLDELMSVFGRVLPAGVFDPKRPD